MLKRVKFDKRSGGTLAPNASTGSRPKSKKKDGTPIVEKKKVLHVESPDDLPISEANKQTLRYLQVRRQRISP